MASMATRPSSQNTNAPSHLSVLAEAPEKYVDGAAMDYLLIEMVKTLKASAAVAASRAKKIEEEMVGAGLLPPPPTAPPLAPLKHEVQRDSLRNIPEKKEVDEEEGVRARLEAIGIHVGANFTERLSRDRALFSDTLDVIKFICKDVWVACWDKQVDNLRTNHRGVYVLQDNSFKPISRLSSPEGRLEATKRAKLFVSMPAGIIKGSLLRLGFQCTVVPETISPPGCTFQVKLPRST